MKWGKEEQLRYVMLYALRFQTDGQPKDILEFERELGMLGFDGMIGTISAHDAVATLEKSGWVEIAPSGRQLRMTPAGIAQVAKWKSEDAEWTRGTNPTSATGAWRETGGGILLGF